MDETSFDIPETGMSDLLPTLPGSEKVSTSVQFQGNRLIFARPPSKEELIHLIALVRDCHDYSTFWASDLLIEVKNHYGEVYAKEVSENFANPAELMEAMKVTEGLSGQRFRLSYQHHREALVENGGDGKAAVRWLQRAEAEQWTPAQLRASIRRALSGNGQETRSAAGSVTITTDLRRFQDRLKKILEEKPVSEWTPAELEAFTEDAEFLLDFAFEVKLRAGGFPQKLRKLQGDE